MSLVTYTVKAIRCDLRVTVECADEFEGGTGGSAQEVREAARAEGWWAGTSRIRPGKRLDGCPACWRRAKP